MTETSKDETYSEEETKARAEATLRNMLATPHKPHKNKSGDKPAPEGKTNKRGRGT